jgi:hypothetical protein
VSKRKGKLRYNQFRVDETAAFVAAELKNLVDRPAHSSPRRTERPSGSFIPLAGQTRSAAK